MYFSSRIRPEKVDGTKGGKLLCIIGQPAVVVVGSQGAWRTTGLSRSIELDAGTRERKSENSSFLPTSPGQLLQRESQFCFSLCLSLGVCSSNFPAGPSSSPLEESSPPLLH